MEDENIKLLDSRKYPFPAITAFWFGYYCATVAMTLKELEKKKP